MKITSSYRVKLLAGQEALSNTVKIYQDALAYIIHVVNENWSVIAPVYENNKNNGQRMVERLLHKTKTNLFPKYDFDVKFPKFPSYFRRAAITAALGCVSSYYSNMANWEAAGGNGKMPTLTYKRNAMPTFFRTVMSQVDTMLLGQENSVKLKLFWKNDWIWFNIPCRRQDVKYIVKYWSCLDTSAPTLEIERKKKGRKNYYIRFAFTGDYPIAERDEPLENRVILAIDLGINTDAVCSVMKSDGTVIARKFINFAREKDQLNHTLNRIKRLQREHGRTGGKYEWSKAMRISDDLSRKISNAIVDFACQYAVNVIVFEHLSMTGKIYGGKKQRLHLWRKNSIQDMVAHKAHRNLIRISHICAWNTSKLAYDGSGKLTRDSSNHSLATFSNGKQYNCDLSASYNIGARYFLREYCYVSPDLNNNLPCASRRTYADLRKLFAQSKPVAA